MKEKINLVYIASNGRSGSTLLEMMLGSQNRFFSMGELQMLPMEMTHAKQKCSCGAKVPDCPFWTNIMKEKRSSVEGIDYFRKSWSGKVLRWQELKEIVFNTLTKERYERIQQYGKDNFDVMNTVLKNLEAENESIHYLVDASKDPYRLYWLQKSGYFNIKVLHIVKHPQGFVYSMTKVDKGVYKIYKSIRMSFRWIIENSLIEYVIKKAFEKSQYKKIRYEELASTPEKLLQDINSFLEYKENNVPKIMESGHAISGNAMCFGPKEIKLDEKWKIKQQPFIKLLVAMITYPFIILIRY